MKITRGTDPLATMVPRRKTVTFSSDSGTVTVFTITGRVMVSVIAAFCTTSLVENGVVTGIELGTAADPNLFILSTDPDAIDANEFWANTSPIASVQVDALQVDVLLSEDIILKITGGTDIASGVIVFDVLYLPITDGAGLVAA